MAKNDLQRLILDELRGMRQDLGEVRTKDIPALKADVAGFHEKIAALDSKQKWSTRLYTLVGGAIAVVITKFTGHN